VVSVLTLSIAPMVMGWFGLEFGVYPSDSSDPMMIMRGASVHTILEWTGVLAAFFTALLSLVHYRLEKDPVTPVIGVALFCAGWVDAFHVLGADRLIGGLAPTDDYLAFTWALARTFHALILLVGPSLFYLWASGRAKKGRQPVIWVGGSLMMIAAISISLIATSESVPAAWFPDQSLRRPWDTIPLGLFVIAGGLVYPAFHRRYGSVFTHSLLVSMVPAIVSQLHMAFGSMEIYDHHFNVAHGLKALAYLVPFAGLSADYMDTLAIVRRQSRELWLVQDALGTLKRRETTILETTSDGVVGLDRAGHITFANRAATELLKRSALELRQIRLVDQIVPDDPFDREALARALEGGKPHVADELQLEQADGERIPVELQSNPVLENGRVQGAVVTFRDITVRRARERELRETTRRLWFVNHRLVRTNEQLEQFAYIASHDLKAPLRAVASLATWIEEDLGDAGSAEVTQHLRLLRSRVKRMERLLQDLLRFARVGQENPRLETVDVAELVRSIAQLQDTPAGMQVAPAGIMPVFETARTPLEHVLMNLIGNAVRHHDLPKGRIEVRCENDGAWMRFRVSDNGPGIPAEYHDKVFRVLTTLQSRDSRETSGMGLAIVKKLVENGGGTVSIEANEPRGTTFLFTWPQRWPEAQ
jgi:PAS domain S-box-containing protein